MRPLALKKMPGVGPRTCEVLENMGVNTIGALADLPLSTMLAKFGPSGYGLQRAASGICESQVVLESLPKSISRETTFEEDLADWKQITRILIYLAERAAHNLREHHMECRCVTLKVRYADFDTHTFACTLPEATCLDGEVIGVLHELIPKARARRARVRLIGVALTSLRYNQHQLALFGRPGALKWERVLESVDQIRERHGFELIRLGRSISLGKKVNLSTPSLSR